MWTLHNWLSYSSYFYFKNPQFTSKYVLVWFKVEIYWIVQTSSSKIMNIYYKWSIFIKKILWRNRKFFFKAKNSIFLLKVKNITNCQKSANFLLPIYLPFCTFSKNFFDENTSFVLYFNNFNTRGLYNSIHFYLKTLYLMKKFEKFINYR